MKRLSDRRIKEALENIRKGIPELEGKVYIHPSFGDLQVSISELTDLVEHLLYLSKGKDNET